jgi:hypothetical protein
LSISFLDRRGRSAGVNPELETLRDTCVSWHGGNAIGLRADSFPFQRSTCEGETDGRFGVNQFQDAWKTGPGDTSLDLFQLPQ